MRFAHVQTQRVRAVLAALVVFGSAAVAWGGNNGFVRNNAVGGISVDPSGALAEPSAEGAATLARLRAASLEEIPADLATPAKLRMISLKGLVAAIQGEMEEGFDQDAEELPDHIKYLAGLQRVQYVFVYPDRSDIVLAGPAEPWKIDDHGRVVGKETGLPTLRLEDLLIALRSVDAAREVGITCSIDPTAEGRRALQEFLDRQKFFSESVVAGIARVMGDQTISLTGVPASSHFARVMVASDYRMKRIAMKLEPTPLPQLPSFLDLVKSTRGMSGDVMPRWWLACNYEPVGTTDDGLAWEIRGPGVKAMTEDDLFTADGEIKHTGKKNPVAQRWADLMTEHYLDLSKKDPVFCDLRNIMDMCVVAALIRKEHLADKAGLDLALLAASGSDLKTAAWNTPKSVATQVSYLKRGRSWIITASGGVDISSWEVAEKTVVDAEVGQARAAAGNTGRAWYWN